MGALQALVTIVGLIGILALLLLVVCRYLGGWTWTRAWLTSSHEEKMVLTRGTGKYHPNGFMIPSESDLNLSGGGSFRRFDKTDHDYQLLRQGSTASIPHQSNIPPQPLRPAPVLPLTVGQQNQNQNQSPNLNQNQAQLEEQSSIDSVFADSPAPKSSLQFQMPPPRIPPPPPPSSAASASASAPVTAASSFSTSSNSRAAPSFSMTNPFLPLLQASTQFFSQTLQGLQSFQSSDQVPGNSSESSGSHYPNMHRPLPPQVDPHNSYNHSSTSSGRSVGMSMGEYLFSAPPVVSPPSGEPAPVPLQQTTPPLPPSTSSGSGVPSAAEFFQSPPMSYSESHTSVKLDPSNPFSPLSTTAATTFDYLSHMDSTDQLNTQVQDGSSSSSGGNYNWANQIDENDVTNTSLPSPPPALSMLGNTSVDIEINESISIHTEFKYQDQPLPLPEKTIFDEIRDFNDYAMSKNEEDLDEPPAKPPNKKQTSITEIESSLIEPLNSIQISNFKSTAATTNVEDIVSATNSLTDSLTNSIDNPDPVTNLNSMIPTSVSGSHYSNFTPYRNVRSFSLRQASTDSIGSADGSDLGSPDNSLPSLQRAMSCDSVCSDTSVVLGEMDAPHLTGHLSIGLEYDSETADLLVNVIEAKEINGLHPDSTTPFDSYVRVYLLPDKTTNMQTRVYRKNLNPVYKEKFMFGLELAELPIRSLVFYLYATDKFSNTLIGETELKLRDLDVHQLPITTWLPLTDTGQRGGDLGEIMFSLSYLPTAERLTVVVVKARNLKFPRDNSVGDPFVKVYLLQRGKKVSKKKSSTKRGEKNPIFNEAMIFGVPAHALQTIQLRITVADVGEAESNRAYSVGHVLVGSASTGKPLSHWNQMLSSLRKPIAMWHSLRK